MIYLNARENGDKAERNPDLCCFYLIGGLAEQHIVAFSVGESMHIYSHNTEVYVCFGYQSLTNSLSLSSSPPSENIGQRPSPVTLLLLYKGTYL